jgi:hypothetical protein
MGRQHPAGHRLLIAVQHRRHGGALLLLLLLLLDYIYNIWFNPASTGERQPIQFTADSGLKPVLLLLII